MWLLGELNDIYVIIFSSVGEGVAIHSSILAWEIPWTEKPDGLQSMGSQKLDTT